jgi:hypothetical protein
MHVREVNPVVNATFLHYLERKSPHEQIPELAPNRLKFFASTGNFCSTGNRTQTLRERLYPTQIKHHAQVKLTEVIPKHCEELT